MIMASSFHFHNLSSHLIHLENLDVAFTFILKKVVRVHSAHLIGRPGVKLPVQSARQGNPEDVSHLG